MRNLFTNCCSAAGAVLATVTVAAVMLVTNNGCIQPPAFSGSSGLTSCTNGIKDGDETDVDCGGSCTAKCPDTKDCTKSTDCQSGVCTNQKCVPAPATCSNGQKDGQETDVDCGDGCPACADGKDCLHGTDCQSGVCTNQKCVPAPNPEPSCTDGKQNGSETDVDCGGSCSKCGIGKRCNGNVDCASNFCNGGICASQNLPSCTNNVQDGQETDIDCGGGSCAKCADGKNCNGPSDCVSNDCSGGKCVTPQQQQASCFDHVKNGTETDIDCGGNCQACNIGQQCAVGGDCVSGTCTNNVCASNASCNDGVRNGNETDVDCGGGSCAKCADGRHCAVGGDCVSGTCTNNACVTPQQQQQASCNDGVKNGTETDRDCGGNQCPKCSGGQSCVSGNDCVSGTCTNNACVGGGSCNDGIKNGSETDVDCGGGTCSKCLDGQLCNGPSDCAGNNCVAGRCSIAACSDNVRDGNETDVDCGGGVCKKCGLNGVCTVNADCASGTCINSRCANAAACSDNVRDGNETDVDCGGNQCATCVAGKHCFQNSDCQSNSCTNGTCGVGGGSCNDGIWDGQETDVDCGGNSGCGRCNTGMRCIFGSDCASGICSNGFCQAPQNCGGLGQACCNGTTCSSGSCVNGFCQAQNQKTTFTFNMNGMWKLQQTYPGGGMECWNDQGTPQPIPANFNNLSFTFQEGLLNPPAPNQGSYIDCIPVTNPNNPNGSEVALNPWLNQACSVTPWFAGISVQVSSANWNGTYASCSVKSDGIHSPKLRFYLN